MLKDAIIGRRRSACIHPFPSADDTVRLKRLNIESWNIQVPRPAGLCLCKDLMSKVHRMSLKDPGVEKEKRKLAPGSIVAESTLRVRLQLRNMRTIAPHERSECREFCAKQCSNRSVSYSWSQRL